jgi:ABC-2 type transport system ATP-binding protein
MENEVTHPVLSIRDLSFSYSNELPALRNVDLDICEGEIFGLLGLNGAGKTTLIRIILGLLHQSSGQITWNAGNHVIAQRAGYVPEKIEIYPYLTGREFLSFHAGLLKLSPKTRGNQIDALIGNFELGEVIDRRVSGYSKGQRQRLAIGQALLGDPKLLILDEPTDGLDPLVRRDVLRNLSLLRKPGRAIIINSHQLHELEKICDRIAILHKGKVLAHGRIQDLLLDKANVVEANVVGISKHFASLDEFFFAKVGSLE